MTWRETRSAASRENQTAAVNETAGVNQLELTACIPALTSVANKQ